MLEFTFELECFFEFFFFGFRRLEAAGKGMPFASKSALIAVSCDDDNASFADCFKDMTNTHAQVTRRECKMQEHKCGHTQVQERTKGAGKAAS